MSVLGKTGLYVGFSILAILANLGAQRLVLWALGTGYGLWPALVAGTGTGLVLKYLLDKRWIFEDRATGLKAHGTKFSRYTGMGAITTALFWAVEYGFWRLGGTQMWREIGAVLGLGLGYAVKYWLDARFVFSADAKGGMSR